MTETNYTPVSAYADLARAFHSVQADLQRALDSISENFLLPSQERAQLIDALERAVPMADPFYSLSATQMLILTTLAALPGLDSLGEGAAKIVACADDLLVAMKEDDILYVAKQGDWGALAACLREYPAILEKRAS
jgi:hypothetical protein